MKAINALVGVGVSVLATLAPGELLSRLITTVSSEFDAVESKAESLSFKNTTLEPNCFSLPVVL